MMREPARFLQKISVGTGMMLLAMSGPDVPIPIIPNKRIGISRPFGMAV
jgi:hypothetical protein